MTDTENALYSASAEARDLVVELVRIKTRVDRLVRNLDHPYNAQQAAGHIESAARELADVAHFCVPKGETYA